MKAFELRAYDGPSGLHLTDVSPPTPHSDELLLDVHRIGINFPDLLFTRGQYQLKPELPVVPGCEVAGVVASAPAGSGWSVGDRAASFIWQGGFAEQAVVPLNAVARVPEAIDFTSAAAMIVNYQTVLFALQRRARTSKGETVFVMGAAGGIGTAAVQVALGLGARVIAGVANESQIPTAEAAGALETIVIDRGFSATLKDMTGARGVDVVVDPLGDWMFDEAIRGLAPEGRIAVIGFAAGEIPVMKVNRLLLRNIGVIGAAYGAFLELEPGLNSRQADFLNELAASGFVRPQLDAVYPFEDLPEIMHRLGRGEIRGKAVISVR